MSDRPEIAKATDIGGQDVAHQLLTCVRQDIPGANEYDPGAVSEMVYAPGKSGEDFLAGRVFNHNQEKNPPGGVALYELKMDGKLYVDFIQPKQSSAPGKDTMSWFLNDKYHEVKEGSTEFNKVFKTIHNKQLFESCEKLP